MGHRLWPIVALALRAPVWAQPAASPEVIISNPPQPPRPEDIPPQIQKIAAPAALTVNPPPKLEANAPPSPVAMYPRDGEAAPAVTGNGDQSADPDFDAMLLHAFAQRDQRRDQADKVAAAAAAARKRVDDQRARMGANSNGAVDLVLTRALENADSLDARAASLRPKTAPPVSEPERQAAAQRQSDSAPSERDGYCRALLVTIADAPPVAAGPTCACADRYRSDIVKALDRLADKEAKLVAESDLTGRAAWEKAGWEAKTLPNPTAPKILEVYAGHNDRSERMAKETDIARFCRATASREADPRRRLVPREAAEGYEPGGRADRATMTTAFRAVATLMSELLRREQEYAELRIDILQDDVEAREEELQRKQDVGDKIAKWRPTMDAYHDFLVPGTTADKLPPWEEQTSKIAATANGQEAAFCEARLETLKTRIDASRDRLRTILDEYHTARDADLKRFKDDVVLWDRLAKRDGFAASDPAGIDFPKSMPALEAIGKERNSDGTVRRWPRIEVRDLDIGIPIGYPDHSGLISSATAHPNFRLCLAGQVTLDNWLAGAQATGPETTTYRRWRENFASHTTGLGRLINDPDLLWRSQSLEATRDPHDIAPATVAEAKATHRAPGARLPDSGL